MKSVIGLSYFELVMREGAIARSRHWVSVFNDGFGIKVEEFRDEGIEWKNSCIKLVQGGGGRLGDGKLKFIKDNTMGDIYMTPLEISRE